MNLSTLPRSVLFGESGSGSKGVKKRMQYCSDPDCKRCFHMKKDLIAKKGRKSLSRLPYQPFWFHNNNLIPLNYRIRYRWGDRNFPSSCLLPLTGKCPVVPHILLVNPLIYIVHRNLSPKIILTPSVVSDILRLRFYLVLVGIEICELYCRCHQKFLVDQRPVCRGNMVASVLYNIYKYHFLN